MARRPFGGLTKAIFDWFAERFPVTPWAEATRKGFLSIHRQMPRSHAEKYELKTIWYWYPLYCLGGLAFIGFLILTVTGIILGFYYVPEGNLRILADGTRTSEAFESLQFIMTEVPLGFVWRGVHHWAAHIFIAAVFLHMARVYFTGAYKKPRELNWLLGVTLLLISLGFGYTGYLLPWNTLAFAAATIGINMAKSIPIIGDLTAEIMFGGLELGAGTVLRMYWFHIFILPLVGIGVMLLHMTLVWVQGIAEPH
ncbi:MAG: cytochrome bc complex cytochrome b subunit [Thermoplasmata archaeon]